MNVEVGLLGPVELRLGGAAAPLAGAPQRVLLARLALAAGRVVPVSELIDALWGDAPPDNAVGNLHSYVSRLRRHTGSDVIRREPGGYRLDLPAAAIDAHRVEQLVATARRQPAEDAARTLAEALGMWRGDPLSDVADRLAFAPDVARLAEWRRQLREEWLDRRLAAGRAADALPEIEAVATAEPLRERPQLLLMRALHQTGRTAEALAAGRAYRERIVDGHGIDPSPALADLQRRILGDDPALRPAPAAPPAAPVGPARSPAPGGTIGEPAVMTAPAGRGVPRRRADRFVGRQAEMTALRKALADGRVVTVTGPGGAGKTRLVTEVLTGDEPVVELAELSVPADVPVAVAGALGLRVAPRGGLAAIIERLGSAPAVLVLDNCEHLLEAVRELVDEVIAHCPQARVLATSRQRLDAAGERVLRLGPLPADDQVTLFCDRAALLRADYPDDPRTRALAGEVCALVDGLPLAVELAARREAVFGLTQLRDRLGAGLHVLDPARGGDRATAVSATVEWSYRLLDPAAQTLLDRLAVCRGGFGLDALPHFAPDGESLLAELVDASLVTTDLAADPPRYRLLETVRHVGLAHLGPDGERDAREAHARWMVAYAAALLAAQRARDPDRPPNARRELANLQTAISWLCRDGRWDEGARLAVMVAVVLWEDPDPGLTEQLRRLAPERVVTHTDALRALAAGAAEYLASHMRAADRLLTAVLDTLPADHSMRWPALLLRLANAMFEGRVADVHRDARALAEDHHAPAWVLAQGPCCAALISSYSGDPAGAQAWLERYPPMGGDADGFGAFTQAELLAGTDPEAALRWYDTAVARSTRINLTYIANVAKIGRAAVLIRLGRSADAVAACREALEAVRLAGMTAQIWTSLRLAAELLAGLGRAAPAAAIVAAADAAPLAPTVMGADLDRQARIRRAGARPPGRGDTAAAVEFALAELAASG
ncbi:MAG TPA: BTAD domain-containing putative transcriptional regulator [Actinoplanes sp.]|nr:BTAD domain-containing putative transcriptional regulator [Actinoplanes sp.]